MPEASLVHRSDPMPTLGDAVDHARNQLGLQLSGHLILSGWWDARIGIAAPALVMLLDALVEARPELGENPFKAGAEQLTWTGPATGVIRMGDGERAIVAMGHHDPEAYVRLTRERAADELRWTNWSEKVADAGVAHLHMLRPPGAHEITFTPEPGADTEPVTVWASTTVPLGVAITT